MPTIFELVNPKAIGAYYTETTSNSIPYLGATLFPARKKLGLDLKWIKGAGGLPVSLAPSAFDTKATVRDRIGLKDVQEEMPFFRESMRVGEKDRQDLLRLLETNNEAYYNEVIRKIFDDATTLVSGAQVVPERMIMQPLTGEIHISANRMPYDYDYKMPATHKVTLTGADKWDDPGADIVGDIKTWQDLVEDETGSKPTKGICSLKTWNYIMKNTAIRLDMNPLGGMNIIMTDSLMKQYLQNKLGISIAVYNKKYGLLDGSSHLFYPDDYFTLIPDGNLGTTWYGTTPEEADLMSGGTDAQVQIVNTGVAITAIKESHPVNVETIVSEIVLPSFEQIERIFIAKVA